MLTGTGATVKYSTCCTGLPWPQIEAKSLLILAGTRSFWIVQAKTTFSVEARRAKPRPATEPRQGSSRNSRRPTLIAPAAYGAGRRHQIAHEHQTGRVQTELFELVVRIALPKIVQANRINRLDCLGVFNESAPHLGSHRNHRQCAAPRWHWCQSAEVQT